MGNYLENLIILFSFTVLLIGGFAGYSHTKKMQTNQAYRQEYIDSHKEENKKLKEIVDGYVKKSKWCYGR